MMKQSAHAKVAAGAHAKVAAAILTAIMLGGLALGQVACGSTQVGARLVLPPTTIVGDPLGRRGDIYDAYELFDRAEKSFVAADWPRARALYEKLIAEYPASNVMPLARYNLGLVHERGRDWAAALAVYRSFPTPPGRGVRLEEVRLRTGVCLSRLERHADAQAEFQKILDQFGVPRLEYNEARARLGIAAFHAGNEVLAEHYLAQAFAEYEANLARGVCFARAAHAEGYFVMGEIYFRRFQEIELGSEHHALARLLRQKAETFVVARAYYTQAIRTHEPTWLVASLFRLGMGYELFYREVLAVPTPPELLSPAQEEYRAELALKLKPVLDKALTAYRRNLELAVDLRVDGPWVKLTRERYVNLSELAQRAP